MKVESTSAGQGTGGGSGRGRFEMLVVVSYLTSLADSSCLTHPFILLALFPLSFRLMLAFLVFTRQLEICELLQAPSNSPLSEYKSSLSAVLLWKTSVKSQSSYSSTFVSHLLVTIPTHIHTRLQAISFILLLTDIFFHYYLGKSNINYPCASN